MKLEDFYLRLIKTYHQARLSKHPHDKIVRGRSYSISSEAEDLFANYVANNLHQIDMIRVDQALTVPASHPRLQKHKTFYPDLSIITNDEIRCMIDLKLDMGWNRKGLGEVCKKHHDCVELSAGGELGLTINKNTDSPERTTIKCSKELVYLIVLLSGGNQNQTELLKSLEAAKRFSPKVEVFVLSNQTHPNDYNGSPDETLKKLNIDYNAARELISKVERSLHNHA